MKNFMPRTLRTAQIYKFVCHSSVVNVLIFPPQGLAGASAAGSLLANAKAEDFTNNVSRLAQILSQAI